MGDAVRRARTSLALMEQLDLVGRTGETARAFGIDFLAVSAEQSSCRCHTQRRTAAVPGVTRAHTAEGRMRKRRAVSLRAA